MKKTLLRSYIKKALATFVGIVLFLALYECLAFGLNTKEIPHLDSIWNAIVDLLVNQNIHLHILNSLKIVGIAYLLGIVFGIILGSFLSMNQFIKGVSTTLFSICSCISALAIYPILLIIFGINDWTRVIILSWITIPSFLNATIFNISKVSDDYKNVVQASMIDNAGIIKTTFKIKLPIAMPSIFANMMAVLGSCFISLLVAEMMGSNQGIGYLITRYINIFKYPEVYACIFYLILMFAVCIGILKTIKLFYERRCGFYEKK